MVDFIDFDGDTRLQQLTEKFLAGLYEGGFTFDANAVAGATVAQILTNPADLWYFTETKLRKHHQWTVLRVLAHENVIVPFAHYPHGDFRENADDPTIAWIADSNSVADVAYLRRKSQRTAKSVNNGAFHPNWQQETEDLLHVLDTVGATDPQHATPMAHVQPIFGNMNPQNDLTSYTIWTGEPHGLFRLSTPYPVDDNDPWGGTTMSLTPRGRQAVEHMRRRQRQQRDANQPPNSTGGANARVCVG